jgi:hypothetical protein
MVLLLLEYFLMGNYIYIYEPESNDTNVSNLVLVI